MFHGFHKAVAGHGRGHEMRGRGANTLVVLGGHYFSTTSNNGTKAGVGKDLDGMISGFFAFMIHWRFMFVGVNMLK